MPPATLAAALAAEQQGLLDEAVALYAQLLEQDPQCVEALNNLGGLARRNGLLDEAIDFFQQALQRHPNYLPALVNLARCLSKGAHYAAADAAYVAALKICPAADAKLRIALLSEHIQLHYGHGQLVPAQALAQAAQEAFPQSAELLLVAGNVALYLRDADTAAHCYRSARQLEDSPRARANLALALLAQDAFATAWPLYESRYADSPSAHDKVAFPAQSCPQWQGQPLHNRRLLVLGEQGMGDQLHFARFLSLAAAQGARVCLQCPPALRSLLASTPGLERVATYDENLGDFDYWSPLLSLPLQLGGINGRQFNGPYLHADAPRRALWRSQLDGWRQGKPTVGLVWAGSGGNAIDRMRSLSQAQILDFVRPFAGRALFFSLQKDGVDGPALAAQCQAGIIPLADMLHDFADTAALVAELDIIISVDSAVAHLCGALGVPAHVLLSPAADWRWGRSGTNQVELYASLTPHWRGPTQTWPDVLAELTTTLNEMLNHSKAV